jgi:hypothetical protein
MPIESEKDLLTIQGRKLVIQEIQNEENYSRKREAQRRFDVYRDRQDNYILEHLQNEFDYKTVLEMRKILSINLSKRIIDEESSIYSKQPEREFSNANEKELEQINKLYDLGNINTVLKRTNRYFNLFNQTPLMVLPKDNVIMARPLGLQDYDVIPMPDDPEKAMAYVLNVWPYDRNKSYSGDSINDERQQYYARDDANQTIADDDDRKAAQKRMIVWTDNLHFTMNGKGEIIGEVIENPIGRLPFIDIAMEKDNQFFVRRGSSTTNFSVEFGACLSDLANISRLQGYAQAVITSEIVPQNLKVGPNHVLWLKLDPNAPETKPNFQFVSPAPDLASSLNILESIVKFYLSSRGIDPKTISGKGDSRQFTSGVDRLLSLMDKFEASADDFDLFEKVEVKLFDLMRDWSNVMQGVSDETRLVDSLNTATLNDNIELDVKFKGPEFIKTDDEKTSEIERKLEIGLISMVEAIMMDRDVSEERALEVLEEIRKDQQIQLPSREVDDGEQTDSDENED